MAKVSINIKKGTLKNSKTIVGIDLGTTNSLVAYINQKTGKPEVIGGLVPSIIQYIKDSQWTVGELAKQQLSLDPCKTIYSVKRLLGKNYKDLDLNKIAYSILDNNNEVGLVKIEIDNKYFNPIELSSIILKELKANAEKALKTEVNHAVITVPAYFNDSQRQATRDAGKLAGLNVLRIVNEPTAASLAYGLGLDKTEEKTIAVYDLGGGTFDVSILRIQSGVFEVLATNGDTYLGGDDIDWEIINHWQKIHVGVNKIGKKYVQQLRLIAEKCKIHLSKNEEFTHKILDTELSLSQQEFKNICKPIIDKTIEKCKLVLKDAEVSKQEIDEVIMVGGSTKNTYLRSEIKAFFGKELNTQQNPDTVVALGAAIEADILAGNRKDLLLLDVTPLSLGIETLGGLMDTIITRNSKIPNIAGRDYTTSIDGQVNLKINVYQGERELVKENRKLASFELKNIPSMPAGMPKINVTFMLNPDGILKIKAIEKRSNTVQELEVKPSYGLTDKEVENMLLASVKNAKSDIKTRLLIEAKGEADQVVYITEQFLVKNKNHLSNQEVEQTRGLILNLQKEIKTENKDAIHLALDTLNNYTQGFAQRIMNITIKESLQGKIIE